eukprot:GDKK01002303.1.p1 GENE.GDKK01002303.1~~GDKK01002303.1.p1  ORF type:complete len:123 (+),score=16.22 GDKK01002303.1:67-435(+)
MQACRELIEAAAYNNVQTIALLLSNGANVNISRNGPSPLHIPARHSRGAEAIQLLLAHGADIDAGQNENGWTPMFAAAERSMSSNMQLLASEGANPSLLNAEGRTAELVFLFASEEHFSDSY